MSSPASVPHSKRAAPVRYRAHLPIVDIEHTFRLFKQTLGWTTPKIRTPEAGTSQAHREMIRRGEAPTALTRAFTGRTARGISNRFLREHTPHAPTAYPEIHHLTAPLRSAARDEGDADGMHLWAGQAYPLAEPTPAAELVRKLAANARDALQTAAERIKTGD